MTTVTKLILRCFVFIVLLCSGIFEAFGQGRACLQLDPAGGLYEFCAPDSISGDWWMQFVNASTTNTATIDSLNIAGTDKALFGINSITLPYKVGDGFYTGQVDWFVHFQIPTTILQHEYSAMLRIVTTNDSCGTQTVPLDMKINTQSPDSVYDLFHAPELYSEDPTQGVEHVWRYRNTSQDSLGIIEEAFRSTSNSSWYIRNMTPGVALAPGDTLAVDVINTQTEPNVLNVATVQIRTTKWEPPVFDSVDVTIADIWWPAASAVSEQEQPEWTLTANPNPTKGQLHASMNGAGEATFEVYDMLGNLVARSEPRSMEWTWSGTNMRGQPVANGPYFLRAESLVAGTLSVRTLRIMVEQ